MQNLSKFLNHESTVKTSAFCLEKTWEQGMNQNYWSKHQKRNEKKTIGERSFPQNIITEKSACIGMNMALLSNK